MRSTTRPRPMSTMQPTMNISPRQATAINILRERSSISQYIPTVADFQIDPAQVAEVGDRDVADLSAGEKELWLLFLWVLYPHCASVDIGALWRRVDARHQQVAADVISAAAPPAWYGA